MDTESNTNIFEGGAPFTVTSRKPGEDKVPLGQAMAALTEAVLSGIGHFENAIEASEKLENFSKSSERYANARQLAKISTPHALKAWAAERLPSFGISYGFSNRLTKVETQQNFDERASLKLVQFADDLTTVARFCRDVSELLIDVDAHSHGIEFHITLKGRCLDERFEAAERHSIEELLQAHSGDNSFKHRVIATSQGIEAQSILFRKKVRLGFSPLF